MSETPFMATESEQKARKILATPKVIAKTRRHKAQRVILTENAEAIIERKLGWMPEH
jgi:hypothetical protein